MYNPLGAIGTLIGLVMMLGLVLKDYSPLLTFDIGSMQMLAIFSGTSLALVGIGFMAMGNTMLSGSMEPIVLQLEALTKEEGDAEAPPGKPMTVKRVVSSPTIDADTGEVEPAGEIEVEVEAEEPIEEEEEEEEEAPAAPMPEPVYASAEVQTEAPVVEEEPGPTVAEEPTVSEEPPVPEGPPEPVITEETPPPVEKPVVTEEVTSSEDDRWSSMEQEAEQLASDLAAEAEKGLMVTLDEEDEGIPGPELGGAEAAASEVSDTSEVMETEEVVEEFLCPSCQRAVGEDDSVCPHCGVKFSEEEEMVMEESAEAVEASPSIEDVGGEPVVPEESSSSKILEGILNEISRLDSQPGEPEPEVEQDEAAELPATCPKCGRNLKPRWKSCPYCGLEFR
jgi:RNA polymerase subunit RPABC4/transcription elongation factor Spt4